MNTSDTINVPVSSAVRKYYVNIRVTGMRRFNIRCWIGLQFLRLARFVFPFNVSVEIES